MNIRHAVQRQVGMGPGWGARLLRGCLLLVAVSAVGCAGTIDREQTLKDEEGAVTMRLITDESTHFSAMKFVHQVNVRRIPPEENAPMQSLARIRSVSHGAAIYSAVLKPGRYQFLRATGSTGGGTQYATYYSFPVNAVFDTFEVRKGEVTMLGTLVLQDVPGPRLMFGYVPPDVELRETFEMLYPAMALQVRGRPVNTVDMTPELNLARSQVAGMKRLTYAFNGLWQAPNGDFLAGSRLGKVLWKKADEPAWRELDTGSWREVLAVRPYAGGLLAGGEEGLLRYSADGGVSWTSLTPPERGIVYALDVRPDGKVLATIRRATRWSVHITDDPRTGPWRELGVLTGGEGMPVTLRKIGVEDDGDVDAWWPPSVAFLGNRVGLMTRSGNFHVLDLASGKTELLQPRMRMFSLVTLADGALLMRAEGFGQNTLVSVDEGRNWEDLHTSGTAAFADRNRGYVIKRSSVSMTLDGGKTWKQTADELPWKPFELREVVVDRKDGALVVVLHGGSVHRSSNDGRTWKKER